MPARSKPSTSRSSTSRSSSGAAQKKSPRAKQPAAGDALEVYRSKRDFKTTKEPRGGSRRPPSTKSPRFVVQRHRARALHYDLRLEANGVLMSWAVPKGPTLDPEAKRMAVHVEDHPLEYFDFEGTIPAGEYGGGDVIVWDWGTWKPADDTDPSKAVAAGDLHFDLEGEKLRGRFALVRRGERGKKEQWLLIHKNDSHAVKGWDAEQHPTSVKSGRTNDEVKGAPSATWSSSNIWVGPTTEELEALDELGRAGEWEIGEHRLKLTNLDKVLFPGRGRSKGLTKRDLIRHFTTMAPAILPYLEDRAVNLHRYPDGVEASGFWQKSVPSHAPDWLRRWSYPDAKPGDTQEYLVLDSAAALGWVANNGTIEIHPWTSRIDKASQPTWALIDIDPGERSTFDEVVTLAKLHRTALDHLGLEAMPKVTGQRGLQIWIPIARRYTYEQTRDWVEQLSRLIGNTAPDLVTWEWEKAKRKGRIRLDYTQNVIGKTLVAPFSTRPAAGAPVSVPITWDELDDPELRPDTWTISNVGTRLTEVGDPLAPLIGMQQRLPKF